MTKKTAEQISYNMKKIKSKGTKIEKMLMKELWHRGLRYRKNVSYIYGKPDIAFISKKSLYFVIMNFGMDITGKNGKMTLNLIKIFGFPKSKKI